MHIFTTLVFCLAVLSSALAQPTDDRTDSADWPPGLREELQKAENMKLISVDPDLDPIDPPPGERFCGYLVLGSTILEPARARPLAKALIEGIDGKTDRLEMLCFEPRHGLVVGEFELIICFECCQIYVFSDYKQVGKLLTTGYAYEAFAREVRDQSLAWPGWNYDENDTFVHASGLAFTPGTMDVSPGYDDWLYISQGNSFPEVVGQTDNSVSYLSNGPPSQARTFRFVRARRAERYLRKVFPDLEVAINVDNNVLYLDGPPDILEKAKTLSESIDSPEYAVSLVGFLPVKDSAEAEQRLDRLLDDWDLSEEPWESVALEGGPASFVSARRTVAKIDGILSQITVGYMASDEHCIVFQSQLPAEGAHAEIVEQTLSKLRVGTPARTFEYR